jgi:peptidoglycan hydrolase CwlO-like protein
MDILAILNVIKNDWAILIFFFSLGAAWLQGKNWFDKVNKTLDSVGVEHKEQTELLSNLHQKVDQLDKRVDSIDSKVSEIHNELHNQEIKLAVLETASKIKQSVR